MKIKDCKQGTFKMRIILTSCLIVLLTMTSLNASTLAIIDSGVDYLHKDLADQMWKNPGEIPDNRRDDDGNLFRDDVYGWNFAAGNNQVINYNYLGTFSQDPYKFLEIQSRYIKGDASEEELAWMKSKREDKDFIKEMQIFGNFAHGTHVARISSRIATKSKIMAIKLLATERGEAQSWLRDIAKSSHKIHRLFGSNDSIVLKGGGGKKKKGKNQAALLRKALKTLAEQQITLLESSFRYASEQGATVVNGSFGTSFNMIKVLTDNAFRIIYLRKPSKEESDKTAKLYFKFNLDALKASLMQFPKILFVFAAGNDGLNNDIYPSSPANVRLPNVMTVAATVESKSLASFSNYGASKVDVAAPGVGILSAVPSKSHGDEVFMSGTSQASPYVAGVVAQVRAINPKLSSEEVKKIVMKTVDNKEFLFRKVATSGVVNSSRANFAAVQSKKVDLDQAISLSRAEIQPEISPESDLKVKVNNSNLILTNNSSLGDLSSKEEEISKDVSKLVKEIKKN